MTINLTGGKGVTIGLLIGFTGYLCYNRGKNKAMKDIDELATRVKELIELNDV